MLYEVITISVKEFKSKLKALGIEGVEEDRKFKEVLEDYDMSPMDVMEKLGYKKAK